jgi:hypothetical protein
MTTSGTGVADLAVLGLKMSVLMSSYDAGASAEACKASFQAAGEVASACSTDAAGLSDSSEKAWVTESMDAMVRAVE